MSGPPPGWHPDPGDPQGSLRWWDGTRWTEHAQPLVGAPGAAPPLAPGPNPYRGGGQPGWSSGPAAGGPFAYQPGPASAGGFAARNRLSLTAMGVVALYVLLALSTRIALLGIFPILLSVRAIRRREQLAPFAVGAAVIAVIVAIAVISGR